MHGVCDIDRVFLSHSVCGASVRNASAEVTSPTSVLVQWFPPEVSFWNGVITRYVVIYELLRRVDEERDRPILQSQSFQIPQLNFPLANNPDPRRVSLPLQFESAIIDNLEEFYVYRFIVYLENLVGPSEASNSLIEEMPASGMLKYLTENFMLQPSCIPGLHVYAYTYLWLNSLYQSQNDTYLWLNLPVSK